MNYSSQNLNAIVFFIPLRNHRIDGKEYLAIMRDFCCLVKF